MKTSGTGPFTKILLKSERNDMNVSHVVAVPPLRLAPRHHKAISGWNTTFPIRVVVEVGPRWEELLTNIIKFMVSKPEEMELR